MKHRPGSTKADPEKYKQLYYTGKMTNQEIADFFGVHVSTLGNLRKRHGINTRSKRWANGHPLQGKHPSQDTLDKISKSLKGRIRQSNRGWYISHGYKRVRVAANTYKLEHRLVMEQHIGRELTPSEIVHHIDGDKLNNSIENLELTDRREHGRTHIPKGSLVGIHVSNHR